MKKTIISALAFLCLIACVQEEMVSTTDGDAIAFDNLFVDKATRADSYIKETLDGFNVWGYINRPEATLFEGTEVRKDEFGAWEYDELRYWIPQQKYYFAALAPMNSDNWAMAIYDDQHNCLANTYGPGILTYNNVDGCEDLIYAASHVVGAEAGQNQPVSFLFKHLLSKVKFTFANHMGNEYINVRVSEIMIKSPSKASINLASETPSWVPHSEKNELRFDEEGAPLKAFANDVCNTEELFVIPSSSSAPYEISFKIELIMDGVDGSEEILYTAVKNATVSGDALQIGTGYNFSASITPDILDLETIEFKVDDVQNWDEASDLLKIVIASKLGGEVTLTCDVEIPASDVIVVTEDLTINLDGNALKYTGDNRIFRVVDGATLTINGNDKENSSVIVESNNLNEATTAAYIATAYDDSKIIINGGTHTTNGCTVYHANGGTVEINDGTFASTESGYDPQEKYGHKYTLNIQGTEGSIIVRGGSFYKYDPSHSEGESPVANFLEGDLVAVQDGDWYVVKEPAKSVEVGSIDEFNSALTDANVGEINLVADVDLGRDQSISIDNGRNMVINSKDNDIKSAGNNNKWYSVNLTNGSSLTINNTNVNGGGLYVRYGSSLVLNNCDIQLNYSEQSGKRYCIYAHSEAGQPQVVTINGGSYNIQANKKQAYVYACNTTVNITGGTFGPKPSHPNDSNQPIILDDGGQVIITGGTFGFDPTTWVADGYEAIKTGASTWVVSPVASN